MDKLSKIGPYKLKDIPRKKVSHLFQKSPDTNPDVSDGADGEEW